MINFIIRLFEFRLCKLTNTILIFFLSVFQNTKDLTNLYLSIGFGILLYGAAGLIFLSFIAPGLQVKNSSGWNHSNGHGYLISTVLSESVSGFRSIFFPSFFLHACHLSTLESELIILLVFTFFCLFVRFLIPNSAK